MKRLLVVLMVFALFGLAASILLTRLHYQVGAHGFEEKSFCHVSEFLDCDAALASRYSMIGTTPTSELGIIYYLLVFLLLAYALFSERREATLSFLLISSLGALSYSLVMAYLSLWKLGVLCLLCLSTYIANLLLVILLPRALSLPCRKVPSFLFRYATSLAGRGPLKSRPVFHLALTVALFAAGILFFRGLNPEIHKAHAEIPKGDYLKYFDSIPRLDVKLPDRPWSSWGRPDAGIVIVEFSDFQCPFCRRAAFTLKPYLKEFREGVRLVFMNYPLDNACNPAVPHGMHPVSCLAAKAALCAGREGKFWEYHDLVFENQKKLSRAILMKLAVEAGIEERRFDQCLVSDETGRLLAEDVAEGNRLEVRGTPAVFVNGRLFRDWSRPELLRMVIESLLKPSP